MVLLEALHARQEVLNLGPTNITRAFFKRIGREAWDNMFERFFVNSLVSGERLKNDHCSFLPGESWPPPGPAARADGRTGDPFPVACFCIFCSFIICLLGVYRPWEACHFSVVKSYMEYTQNQVWGALGA